MTAVVRARSRSVTFCYADPSGFSGQKAATELVISGLARRGWMCRRLPQPVLERESGLIGALPKYLLALLRSWVRAVGLLKGHSSYLVVNIGQTRAAFVRDSFPILLGLLRLGREHIVVSLHSSLFMSWATNSIDVRLFRFLLGRADVITVLGESQRARLLELGLSDRRVVIVLNSCLLEPISFEMLLAKHASAQDPCRPVRMLHLGSLISTKGFPEYLEALCRLSTLEGPPIEAILCGPLIASEYSDRFPDLRSATDWIDLKIADINRGQRTHARWIKGAVGSEKTTLFQEADVFVLPTRYAVEAQPLVLLEAMASGCAIVTTRVGEITTILDERCCVFLPESSTEALTPVLQALAGDAPRRRRLALAGHERFGSRYKVERYLDQWESLLGGARVPSKDEQ